MIDKEPALDLISLYRDVVVFGKEILKDGLFFLVILRDYFLEIWNIDLDSFALFDVVMM